MKGRKHHLKLLTAAFLILSAAMAAPAEGQNLFSTPQSLVRARGHLSASAFHPGSTAYLAVSAEIKAGWHINSSSPPDAYMIPTELKILAPKGIKVLRILYPEAEEKVLDISDNPLPLYEGKTVFGAILKIGENTPEGKYDISATLDYQGCNDMTCLQPAGATIRIELAVAPPGSPAENTNTAIFSAPPFVDEKGRAVAGEAGTGEAAGRYEEAGPDGETAGAAGSPGGPGSQAPEQVPAERDIGDRPEEGGVGNMFEKRGLLISFVFIFLSGLALTLTPCIYPIIPITISFFGGQSEGKSSRAFGLSLLYVLGISITYSVLGVIAASTGSLLGGALQNPWIIAFISLVLLALATSMFGLWEIRVPLFLTRRTGSAKQGPLGALFMGLTVGIVAAPCIGPFVWGLLAYVGNLGNPVLGFLMFFTLAWGMGVPFIILGTVSGSISRLPRSGEWLDWVRKVFGFVLIAMAVYFARLLLGPVVTGIGYALTALTAGIYLGWVDKAGKDNRRFRIIKKAVGLFFIAAALTLAFRPGGPVRSGGEETGIEWTRFSPEELNRAAEAGRPVMIDFYADWCIPCHEMDEKTFDDPRVMELARRFVALKVDLTGSTSQNREIKKEFEIRGVPTIIFFDSEGREARRLRITGYMGPERFAERMKKVR